MRHASEEYMFEFNLKLLFFLLLDLCYIDKQEDVHLFIHKVDLPEHTVNVLVLDFEFGRICNSS